MTLKAKSVSDFTKNVTDLTTSVRKTEKSWKYYAQIADVVNGKTAMTDEQMSTLIKEFPDLKKKLKSDDRQVIVTTIQKLHRLVTKRLDEDSTDYSKIKNLKIAFVADECHRAVTPGTKRELERFFGNSLWFGFTGTPRFAENPYPQMGDLPRTTEELYGKCLHKYTIQNAIHDNAKKPQNRNLLFLILLLSV